MNLPGLVAYGLEPRSPPPPKLNGLEPEANLRDLFTGIGERPINRLDELLPWNTVQALMRAAASEHVGASAEKLYWAKRAFKHPE